MLITVFYDAKVRYLFYFVNPPLKITYFYHIIMPQKYYLVFCGGFGNGERARKGEGGKGIFFWGGNLARGKRLGMEREGIPYGENGTL